VVYKKLVALVGFEDFDDDSVGDDSSECFLSRLGGASKHFLVRAPSGAMD